MFYLYFNAFYWYIFTLRTLPNQLTDVVVSDIADVIVKVMGLKEPLQTNS